MKMLLAAAALLITALPAVAQQQCGPLPVIQEHLANGYGERLVMSAEMDDGSILQIYLNDQTQTWTAIITNGQIGCLRASGTGISVLPVGLSL